MDYAAATYGAVAQQVSRPTDQDEYRKQREEQEFTAAFQILLRADQYRADKGFMDRLRAWMRGKRAEIDQQLDRIGSI